MKMEAFNLEGYKFKEWLVYKIGKRGKPVGKPQVFYENPLYPHITEGMHVRAIYEKCAECLSKSLR